MLSRPLEIACSRKQLARIDERPEKGSRRLFQRQLLDVNGTFLRAHEVIVSCEMEECGGHGARSGRRARTVT